MSTQLERNNALRTKMLEGVTTLSDYVGSTLGPRGRNVLIHKKGSDPFVTKDGVTVAQNITFDDPIMNSAVEIIKQVSSKTNAEAGDGTTTSTVLAASLFSSACKHIEAGAAPIELKRGLDTCARAFLEMVSDVSRPIASLEDIEHIATISSNNDKTVGKIISTAVDKVGKSGSITIEEGRKLETTLELVEGFQFPSGYTASAFVTDERKSIIRYEDPLFLVTEEKISKVDDILPALEIAARESKPLLIVAEEVDGQALAALIMNTIRGSMKVAALKPPAYGEERTQILSDLCLSTGAKFFQRHRGETVKEVTLSDFGTSESVECSKYSTTIVDGCGDSEKILEKIEELKSEIKNSELNSKTSFLQERVTRLSSGVAIIKIGASSQLEMTEKKHRVEDALEAVNAAQHSGVLPGGGITIFNLSRSMKVDFENESQEVSLEIFKEALSSPLRIMSKNSGMNERDVLERVSTFSDTAKGINFSTGREADMFEEGIIDPAQVVISAVKNAVSVAGTLLLTNHSIIEL